MSDKPPPPNIPPDKDTEPNIPLSELTNSYLDMADAATKHAKKTITSFDQLFTSLKDPSKPT